MNALTFEIHLLEPVLATQPASGEENSATSLGFIPGSLIRGALITRYQHKHPGILLAQDDDARTRFFANTVSFLNAYPLHSGNERPRTLPRPFAWLVDKDERDSAYATFVNLADTLDLPGEHFKKPVAEFCWVDSDHVELYSAQRLVAVHNASNDPNEKAEGKSQVFRYDALAPGESFSAVILAEDVTVLNEFKDLLSSEMLLGGARIAGYGRVQIINPQVPTDWHEYESDPAATNCTVTLLSDLIVRASDGQVGKNIADELARQLQQPGLKCQRAFYQLRLVGGFNRTAGLPLAQEWAVQAGSTFVFDAPSDLNTLIALAQRGIGERTVDGFGRIAINWQMPSPLERRPFAKPEPEPMPAHLTTSQVIAQQMAQRILRTRLERKLVERVTDVSFRNPEALPNNAQLSRVRSAAQQAIAGKGLQELETLITQLKGARQQFERAHIRDGAVDGSMLDWINVRRDPNKLEEHLRMGGEALPRIGSESAKLTPELCAEFTARFIDGVLRKATRANQKEGAE